jgi:hypothetical protein
MKPKADARPRISALRDEVAPSRKVGGYQAPVEFGLTGAVLFLGRHLIAALERRP